MLRGMQALILPMCPLNFCQPLLDNFAMVQRNSEGLDGITDAPKGESDCQSKGN
jgi:hypothetical protein